MPAAEPSVTEQTQTPGTDARRPAFFVQPRPIWHHVVLTLATLGLYLIFWFYRVWTYFRVVRGISVIPLLRAVFHIFFIYPLLRNLRDEARRRGYPESPPAGPLSVLFVALSFCGVLPPPAMFVQMLNVVALLPAFEMANYIWRKEWPGIPERRGFSLGETFLLGLGAFMWANLLYAAIFHPQLLSDAAARADAS